MKILIGLKNMNMCYKSLQVWRRLVIEPGLKTVMYNQLLTETVLDLVTAFRFLSFNFEKQLTITGNHQI